MSAASYHRLKTLYNTIRIDKSNISLPGYDRSLNKFFSPDIGVKIEINYYINMDIKYHIPY